MQVKSIILVSLLFTVNLHAQEKINKPSADGLGKLTEKTAVSEEDLTKSLKPKAKLNATQNSLNEFSGAAKGKNQKNKEEIQKPLSKEDMLEQLMAIDLIDKSKPALAKKLDLELKKAFIHLTIARDLGKSRKSVADMTPEEKNHLEKAMEAINLIAKIGESRKDKLAAAYYLKGLVEFEYDQFVAMQNSLIESLKFDPTTPQAASISIMIAEQYFEDEMYDKAIEYYQMLSKIQTPVQRALANYKTSWSYLSQKKYEQSEFYLLKNFTSPEKVQNLVDESMRDLAFTMTMHRTDESIIELVNQKIPNRQQKAKILYLTLSFFHSQNPKDLKYKLVDEVLKVQENKEERLKTIYYLVEGSRRAYASKDNIEAEKKFLAEYRRLNISQSDKAFTDISKQLENESEFFIKIYLDTYTDKVKNVEGLSREQLAENLIFLIKYHNFMFPDATNKDVVVTLWMDLCVEQKNSPCLTEIESFIDKSIVGLTQKTKGKDSQDDKEKINFESLKKMNDLKDRIELETLVIFEDQNKENGNELAKRYVQYLQKERSKDKEMVILKKLLAIYLKNNAWLESERFFSRLYSLEPNAENLYNLWLSQFKLQKCDFILNSPDKGRYNDKKILDIQRECFLVQAKSSSDKGNISAYKESLKSFLATNPDQEKKALVYLDYFSKLVNSKDYKATATEWDSLEPQIKTRPDFEPIRLNAILGLLDAAEFRGMVGFTGSASKDKEIIYLSAQYELSQNPPNHSNVMKYWNDLDGKQRMNFLSILSLTQHSYLLRSFNKEQFKTADDKRIWLMAKNLEQRTDAPSLSEDEKRYFKEILSKSYFVQDRSKLEDEYQGMKFPEKENPTKYMKLVEGLINKVKAMRPKTLAELKKVSPAAQMNLINVAASIEQRMADTIVNSPLPKELTDEAQKNEYKQGLQGLAKEFVDQSNEFNKLTEGIRSQLGKMDSDKKSQELPEVNLMNWPWSNQPASQAARSLLSSQSPFAAIVYLERQWQLKKISDDDYYWTRSGLLLSVQNSQVMRNYLREELKFNKKDAILSKWRSMK